ncbi:hypothetical protein JB92DRAFT_2026398 [Gautieria morchelliformis]|nr:hypothetical protein JB92DRAFT_2026398 [Gautieria morchelliformis]
MALPEPLESLPVVHHFYPINPDTALQEQSAVYNTADHPLVAPIHPTPSQPIREANSKSNKKRKIQEVDAEVQYLARRLPRRRDSRAADDSEQRHLGLSAALSEPPTLGICPQQPRCVAYVELPGYGSIDLTPYRPLSQTSPATQSLFREGAQYRDPSPSPTSSGESTPSEYLGSRRSIRIEPKRGSTRKPKAESDTEEDALWVVEDEATTCHQCRRKNTREKMHCHRFQLNGRKCPFLFCQTCIEVRYDESFDTSNLRWHCPRCRGICNCSICLRKAGLGYILDGPMSEQLTGIQGRLSCARHEKKQQSRRGGVRVDKNRGDKQPRASVQTWLAKKGIVLGTEEWLMERRRRGVRFVVGKTPPPLDVPSPYKEARFNPTLAACTEYFEDDGIDDLSSVVPIREGDPDILVASGPPALNDSDATAVSRTQEVVSKPPPLPIDVQPNSSALVTTTETHESGLHKSPSPLPDAGPLAPSTPGEDLPTIESARAHGLRLIIGEPLRNPARKNRQLENPKVKKRKVIKRIRNTEVDFWDSDDYEPRQRKPVIRFKGLQVKATQDDEKEEEMESVGGSSTISDSRSPLADALSAAPPPEPVLVPTEYYAPSKLDATMASASQTQLGHTYWSLNTVSPHKPEHEHHAEPGHGPSSLLMSTPLYSNDDQNLYSQFSLDDVSHAGPSVTASASNPVGRDGAHSPSLLTSLSRSHTANDYLKSQIHTHARGDDAYSSGGLAAFTTMDDTWAVDPVFPNLDMDMPPLHMEGIAHAVNAAYYKHQGDQP